MARLNDENGLFADQSTDSMGRTIQLNQRLFRMTPCVLWGEETQDVRLR